MAANNWLERAQREGTPLVDGEQVTFVWLGEQPPLLLADFNGWNVDTAVPLTEVETGVWLLQVNLPRHAYIEYAFITDIERADSDDGRLLDPYNENHKWNGMRATNNYIYLPEARPTPLVRRQPGIPRGALTKHRVEVEMVAAGKTRVITLYHPPTTEPVPLMVVYDGGDYLKQANIDAIVDNLIAQEKMSPVALALLENGRQARALEYGCSDITLAFLHYKVLPLAQKQLNLIDIEQNPGAYAVMGASMGGVMALYTGLRMSHVFGKVLSQSGSFSWGDMDLVVYDLVEAGPVRPLHIWMDVGEYEWLHPVNERMQAALISKGYKVMYQTFPAGHNYYAWRDELATGLQALFGPA